MSDFMSFPRRSVDEGIEATFHAETLLSVGFFHVGRGNLYEVYVG